MNVTVRLMRTQYDLNALLFVMAYAVNEITVFVDRVRGLCVWKYGWRCVFLYYRYVLYYSMRVLCLEKILAILSIYLRAPQTYFVLRRFGHKQ